MNLISIKQSNGRRTQVNLTTFPASFIIPCRTYMEWMFIVHTRIIHCDRYSLQHFYHPHAIYKSGSVEPLISSIIMVLLYAVNQAMYFDLSFRLSAYNRHIYLTTYTAATQEPSGNNFATHVVFINTYAIIFVRHKKCHSYHPH